MRKTLINILAIFCFFLSTFGQETAETIQLGYCYGENEDMGDINSPDAQSVSAAILVSSNMIEPLVGNRMESIRVYIPFKLNITSLTVWMRSALDGENIIECPVKTDEIIKGWNEVVLETPYQLNNNEPFYLGYTFEQKGRAYGICCTGLYIDGGLYYRFDDGEWGTDSKYGNLCLEGVVKGDNLPLYDLELNHLSVPDVYYLRDNFNVNMRVINHAAATINGFTLTYSLPGIFEKTTHVDCNVASCRLEDITLELPPLELPEGNNATLIFNITALDDGEEENTRNNSCEVNVKYTDNSFKKMVLIEEFTTEMCSNCPAAAPKVYEAVDSFNKEHPDGATIICHHAGFYTDFLTTKFDESYVSLYGGGSYAPAAMVDRYAANGSPVFQISTATQVYNQILKAYNRPVNYTLEAEASYNSETSKLTVDVKGSRLLEEDLTPTRISVVIVENNIPSRNQRGTNSSYIHQHAMRTANSTWGETINWSGYNFNYSCDLDINDEWDKEELDIIVYINHYSLGNINDCNVENARKLHFPEVAGVVNIESKGKNPVVNIVDGTVVVNEPYQVENIWTVAGLNVANHNLAGGMYIVKLIGNDEIYIQKVFVP